MSSENPYRSPRGSDSEEPGLDEVVGTCSSCGAESDSLVAGCCPDCVTDLDEEDLTPTGVTVGGVLGGLAAGLFCGVFGLFFLRRSGPGFKYGFAAGLLVNLASILLGRL